MFVLLVHLVFNAILVGFAIHYSVVCSLVFFRKIYGAYYLNDADKKVLVLSNNNEQFIIRIVKITFGKVRKILGLGRVEFRVLD